ncbi:MAG: hypothetical protein HUK03_00710 [Bacteroidaceae bacterium]|nr:hypothetical protein [Bacteroidaceae bacterium]
MTIGILYIGIGRYACFWDEFYQSAEQYLMPGVEKHYYVFTDGGLIAPDKKTSVLHQDDMGWPLNTLFRFKMFLRIKEQLQQHDYLFFMNGNMKVVRPISPEEFLPTEEGLMAMVHADREMGEMRHERRQQSVCYVSDEEAEYYYAGGLNGGKTALYLDLLQACDQLTDHDLAAGIMPVFHDETVINRYLAGKAVKRLDKRYGKPANWRLPKEPKIILRTKEKVLGRNWLRNYKNREHTNTWLRKLLRKLGFVK